MRTARAWLVALVVAVPVAAAAFQADLVPASGRPEATDITGTVSITGADGTVRATVESVNDATGSPLDSGTVTVQLRLRVNGQRRRVTVPVTIDTGDGTAETSLGLAAGDQVVVQGIRLRGSGHRTLAEGGVVTAPAVAPTPPTPDQCPDALASCQDDLSSCSDDLDACESQ
jgi:hypothetical protein